MIAPPRTAVPAELWLIVQPASGEAREVAVEAGPVASVQDLAEALGAHLSYQGNELGLFSERLQAWIPPQLPVVAAGLRSGDTLVIGEQGVTSDWSPQASRHLHLDLVQLAVVGGPRSGERFGLSVGSHVLGRDGDVTLDDPSLSRSHTRIDVEDGRVTVTDLESRNGTAVEGVLLAPGEPRELLGGEVVEAGRTLFTIEHPPGGPDPSGTGSFIADPSGRVPFNRPPRVEPVPAFRTFDVGQPPDVAQKTKLPLMASLLPALLGGALAYMTKRPEMLLMVGLAPLMAIASFTESRRTGRGNYRARAAAFRSSLDEIEAELEAAFAQEREWRRRAAPSAWELLDWATRYRPTLWLRRTEDADFLRLRVGTGRQPAATAVTLPDRGSEELRAEARSRLERFASVSPVPVTVDLSQVGGVGLSGRRDRVDSIARWLAMQVAVLHSPRDVVIAAAIHEEGRSAWDWLKWLPHTHSDTSPIPGRQLAMGSAASETLLASLSEVVRGRRTERPAAIGGVAHRPLPFIVLILDEKVQPSRPVLSEIMADAAASGLAVIWLGSKPREIPGECLAIVEADPERAKIVLTDARTGARDDDVTADGVSTSVARTCATALAPVRDIGTAKGRGSIPRRILLPELLSFPPTPENLAARWESSAEHRGATIGATADGPLHLDLRKDGPHALVAGTTGAGKSELLQTLVAALAAEHPPSRVTFLLIDYKGGAAFKECTELPHVVGFVTDLDEHLTQRAMASLNAELRHREEMLRDAAAKDLADMERRAPDRAPPSLVIVVDEFAFLANEVPDFVAGLVDVAQRGRSLGVHLVLATQRPGGVVSENIRANTNLRIALRVNNPAESSDVIGSDVAARIQRDTPGRAYVRMGHDDLAEFQAAYVGGISEVTEAARPITIRDLTFDARTATQERLAADVAVDVDSDLVRIVKAARTATVDLAIPSPRPPWLPTLPEVLPLADLPVDELPARAVVALVDDPARQRQGPYTLDLARDGSALVYGTSGAGKTTFLRTAAVALATGATPRELRIYGLDFGSRGLQALEALPHVGSVVPGDDEERVTRLFTMLRRELATRREQFARAGAFDLEELRRREPDAIVPRVLVLIDNYAGFVAGYERINMGEFVELVPRLVADGRALGLHFLITGDRRGAIPSSVAGVTPRKVAFKMADEDDLSSLGFDTRAVHGARLPPGRAFGDGSLELQAAIVGNDSAPEAQAAAIRAIARAMDAHDGAPPIVALPATVSMDSLPAPDVPLVAAIGVGGEAVDTVHVNLADGHLLVAGPYRSGRSTTLGAVAVSLARAVPAPSLYLLCPRRTPLALLDMWSAVAHGSEECATLAQELADQLDERNDDSSPVVVVIDDADLLAEGREAQALELIVRRGRDTNVRVAAAGETQALMRAYGGWLREMRKDEVGILLEPSPETDGDLLGVRLPRRPTSFAPGRGYVVSRGRVELMQVAS